METQATGDRVQQLRVGHRDGDDLGDIELEKVDVVERAVDARVANADENQERDRNEVAHSRGYGRVATMHWSGGHLGRLAEIDRLVYLPIATRKAAEGLGLCV